MRRSYARRSAVNSRDTGGVGYRIVQAAELEWVPRSENDPRTVAALSDALTQSRANMWRYPPGTKGKRHSDPVQEEVFVVLQGTLTIDLGEPPQRHEVAGGGVAIVQPGTILQLRNQGSEDVVLYIYGAPPERGQAEFFEDAPD
jgi:mannose-6-phosphate isomerase-like protein (cupin superfamily)